MEQRGIESRTSHMRSEHSTSELQPLNGNGTNKLILNSISTNSIICILQLSLRMIHRIYLIATILSMIMDYFFQYKRFLVFLFSYSNVCLNNRDIKCVI